MNDHDHDMTDIWEDSYGAHVSCACGVDIEANRIHRAIARWHDHLDELESPSRPADTPLAPQAHNGPTTKKSPAPLPRPGDRPRPQEVPT